MTKESSGAQQNPKTAHIKCQSVSLGPAQSMKTSILVCLKEFGREAPFKDIGVSVDYT